MANKVEYRKINEEVLYPKDKLVTVSGTDLVYLKSQAAKNPRQRIRLCTHQNADAEVHEMFIVHGRDSYVRPHQHLKSQESFFLIEGQAEAVFFDDDGRITQRLLMSARGGPEEFYYRIPQGIYHTLIIQSEQIVFFEVTSGPFKPEDTQFAPWAPDGKDKELALQYMRKLSSQVNSCA